MSIFLYKNNNIGKGVINALYRISLFFIYLLSMLPMELLVASVGRMLYFISYQLTKYRYNVVLQNLARSFPHKRYGEIDSAAKGFYKQFSLLVVELIKLFSISRHHLSNLVHVENPELLLAYHANHRNMIGLLGHYGNWECLNVLAYKFPFRVNALYKTLKNPLMDKIVKKVRTRFGVRLIPSHQALRYLLKNKMESQLTLFIADQFPGESNGEPVLFLNQTTQMFDGAEKLAKVTDAVVFYVELSRRSRHGWNVRFSLITDTIHALKQGEVTQGFNLRLQQTIEKDPSFWLWSHRRWK
ncbi:lysophospholipid acyltransferase family protein [Olivibacter sp. CPCC 100613]|uniref:lysophospholipid acyltransferase family protein n=1 Tax=Olivibacter sp. CPCC 100613 TaxID=3079931 RepID=UPI002FFB0061